MVPRMVKLQIQIDDFPSVDESPVGTSPVFEVSVVLEFQSLVAVEVVEFYTHGFQQAVVVEELPL
eukprot:1117516-Prorocentrum_lima.AAC.1